jgi:vanillate O-demethylase ferredoxin subunit
MNTPDLTQTPLAEDGSFEIVLQKSGQTLRVTQAQSILQVLQGAGHDVPFSCAEGICGTCRTPVLAGKPDHWDMYLTPEEQEQGDCLMVCCSRSQTARLVLDL